MCAFLTNDDFHIKCIITILKLADYNFKHFETTELVLYFRFFGSSRFS